MSTATDAALPFVFDDGGRGDGAVLTRDCVTRSIAIAAQLDYADVYAELHRRQLLDRPTMRRLRRRYGTRADKYADPRWGVWPDVYRPYLAELGAFWFPMMKIGSGVKVKMRPGDLPDGRLVVRLSKHLSAVIDGTVHDTHNPCRGGTRAVYGYWYFEG